ncbi:Mov34/MPN/PAD-1 family protein [Olleya namhaensis]|uniref:Mov34/MPN/PAD-1 family protein n=1 Tax=Olleya namhaensis TaxID=1144750 RepID=UPI00249107DD|nr:Mov34/MPN/PAD-1 family protein [Olleya namhaensis]
MVNLINKHVGLEVEFDESLLKELEQIAIKHYPNEIGGYLLGKYESKNKKAVVYKQVLALSYINSPTIFKHIVDDETKVLLEKTFEEEGIHYIGEWHTHPNSNSGYSQTDFKALKKVANDKKTNIENPILLIIGFNKKGIKDYSFYVIENNKIFKYEKE